MNKDKQPGINCKSVILVDSSFRRIADFPNKNLSLNYNFEYSKELQESSANASLSLKLIVNNEDGEMILQLGCTYVGVFCIQEDEPNMELDNFLQFNAPAIVLPYIRHFVHSVTAQAGIEPIILPPINILALLKQSSAEAIEEKE